MPIGCSILPYYFQGTISVLIFPNPETTEFDYLDVHICRNTEAGKLQTFYQRVWKMPELKKAVKNNLLQDVFPELLQNTTQDELNKLNADKATLLELLEDPWHRKAHADSH